jgi:hypothetical protein
MRERKAGINEAHRRRIAAKAKNIEKYLGGRRCERAQAS